MRVAHPVTVAVQGELGSYSELAAYEFFSPDPLIKPCETFAALFEAVEGGQALYGMAPVDNSLGGSIHAVWDLLVEQSPPVTGEILLRVEHCLIAHPGTRVEDVRRVYSHPQALAQCQGYLSGLEGVVQEAVYDTAGAVKMIRENEDREAAAIASAQAAVDYDMAVLVENIQTNHHNFTRFLVLGHAPCHRTDGPLKTTLVLELPESARGLPAVLSSLTRRSIEVLKVECRARLGHPWEYLVYLEFTGGPHEPAVAAAIDEIRNRATASHLVGTYPPGNLSEARLRTRQANT